MRKLFVIALCVLTAPVFAQEKSPFERFGKIGVEDLQKKIYSIDSNANAVILSDIGSSSIEGNSKNFFSVNFTRHCVIHILNKNGYDEANVEIYLYSNGDHEEKLDNVKAVTYNLEGGKIIETKLDKGSIFKEKVDANRTIRKFTMPNVKEGCIVEFEYTVISDYVSNLDPWTFQGDCPELWSEYNLSVPQFFSYAFLSHGYHPLAISDRKDRQGNFNVADTRGAGATDHTSFSAGITDYRWVMKDVPELKLESYTSAIKNHISRIEFQLASTNPPLTPATYRTSWPALVKELSESEYFGSALSKNNNWLSDDIRPVIAGATSETEKAQKIFAFVRDNFTCTDYSALYAEQSLKNVLKSKKGSVAEINLLLTAMLRNAGLKADPVILSTTDHGYALEMYPMTSSFNYVVAKFYTGDNEYYLDATHPRLGFGKMLPECYNGHARVVDQDATAVILSADSLQEKTLTWLFISNDDKGKWTGSVNQTEGYYKSYSIRNKLKEKSRDDFFKQVEKDFGTDVKITNPSIDSLDQFENPVALHYEVELDPGKEDIMYVNPLFGEAWKKNPFQSAERYYPVEMPYTFDETYLLTMEVPNGYVVDELPKQMVAKLDEQGSGLFEYRISQSGTTISMRTSVKIKRTLFMPDEYETLREFFNLIVSKQNEQIVFKKKK